MKKTRELQDIINKEIEILNNEFKTHFIAEIKKMDSNFSIQIFEKVYSHHFYQNAPIKTRELYEKMGLQIDANQLKQLLKEMIVEITSIEDIEQQELPPHPGPEITK